MTDPHRVGGPAPAEAAVDVGRLLDAAETVLAAILRNASDAADAFEADDVQRALQAVEHRQSLLTEAGELFARLSAHLARHPTPAAREHAAGWERLAEMGARIAQGDARLAASLLAARARLGDALDELEPRGGATPAYRPGESARTVDLRG